MSFDIKFKKLNDDAIVPTRATENSAAYDLYCTEDFMLLNGQTKLIKLGFATEIPLGCCAKICPRSGLALKKNVTIVNAPGIIDSDYRDEWGVILHKLQSMESSIKFNKGDRIAQVLFEQCLSVEFSVVDELPKSKRKGGFGSTDK